jgi:hypothetical protein
MKRWILLSGLVALFVTAQSSAQSGVIVRARLNGFSEIPTLSTPARGEFVARITNDRIVYRLSYTDLPTTVTQAHIHVGATAFNGGIAAFLCAGTKPVCPSPSGEVSGEIVAGDVVGPSGQGIAAGEFEEFARAIRAGATYANIHTTQYPAGEIRGQIATED